MTKIDFYILNSSGENDRLQMVCKLINKATDRGQRVFVHSDDQQLLEQLDDCLWHFQPDRFVAHRLLKSEEATTEGCVAEPAAEAPDAPNEALESVLLSSSHPSRTDAVFVNLASTVPVFFSRFERTLEVIDQQESIRLDGRERYRFYKERGYPLQHHNL